MCDWLLEILFLKEVLECGCPPVTALVMLKLMIKNKYHPLMRLC